MTSGWKKTLAATLPAVVISVAAVAYWSHRKNHAIQYITARVERGSISASVTATGTVNPVNTVQVGTHVSGPIKALYADFNSPVKKGDVVALIDPDPFLLKVKEAEADVENARARAEKDKADLHLQEISLKRTEELFRTHLVSQAEMDAAQSSRAQALAQYRFDLAQVKQKEAALEEARVNLNYTRILSPIDGVVVSRNVEEGQTMAASFQTPTLFLIAEDLAKMRVDAYVSESDIGQVREGNEAFFTVDAYPEEKFLGQVFQVRNAPITVQNVVTYDVVINVNNADLKLKPGMTATVSIITAHQGNVLKVPQAALRFRPRSSEGPSGNDHEGERQVWLLTKEKGMQPVAVAVGISDDLFTEITGDGLQEGDEVIIGMKASTDSSRELNLPGFGPRWRRR